MLRWCIALRAKKKTLKNDSSENNVFSMKLNSNKIQWKVQIKSFKA